MQCDAIRPAMRRFLDDLLDEKDYQEVQAHLSGCTRCGAYASSVGTLSYRLHELGQVSLPPDILSTVLYEVKKIRPAAPQVLSPEPHAASGAFAPSSQPYWMAILALGLFSVAATTGVFLWRSEKPQGFTPPAAIAPLALPAQALQPERLAERHFHISLSSRPELADLIITLELAVERDSDRSIIFLVPPEKQTPFRAGLEGITGVVKEFDDAPVEAPQAPERVTVYFE